MLIDGVDDAVAAGEEEFEISPATEADDRRSVDIAGSVLCVIAIKEELAFGIDGVNDAVAAGEEEFEIFPSALADDPGCIDVAGAILRVIAIEEKPAADGTAERDSERLWSQAGEGCR